MADKIEVNLKQAVEFAAKGYDVTCYVVTQPLATKKRASGGQIIYQHTMLMLSMKGSDPTKGIMEIAWKKTKKELWSKDVTQPYSRADIEKSMTKHGCPDSSCVSYLVNKLRVLRRVNGDA